MREVLGPDSLVGLVRWVGVIVGILGTFRASPTAAHEVWKTLRIYGARFRSILRRGHAVNVQAPALGMSISAMAPAARGGARGAVWADDPAEQISILRARTDNLANAVENLRAEHIQSRQEIDVELGALRSEHRTALSHSEAKQEARDRANLIFNARALPLIGASIMLSGLPDSFVAHPWVGWPLLAAAALVTVAVVWRATPLNP